MKAAVLCNGDSRSSFTEPDRYHYIIGCNIPWWKVDATVIVDVGVIQQWCSRKIPPVPTWFSEKSWLETRFDDRKYFEGYMLGLVRTLPEYDSSGHVALCQAIKLGYKQVDIYGCDSWFNSNTDSYTHQFTDSRSTDMSKHIVGWRKRWNDIISSNTEVVINFIGEPK